MTGNLHSFVKLPAASHFNHNHSFRHMQEIPRYLRELLRQKANRFIVFLIIFTANLSIELLNSCSAWRFSCWWSPDTATFKLCVVAHAVIHGSRAAGKQFTVHESWVHRWKAQHELLSTIPLYKWAHRFHLAAFPKIQKELEVWITEKCQGSIVFLQNVICIKAKSVTQKLDIAKESFKASKCWGYSFRKCYAHGFSIWRKTTIAQKLPQDYQEQLKGSSTFSLRKRVSQF